jgi:hypothetical protein
MEIAIVGFNGVALCHACDEACCADHPSWPDCECQAENAYEGSDLSGSAGC